MDGYTLTVQALKTAKSYGMKAPEYLIYADLRAAGWCKRDAWSVAFQGTGLNWEKAELDRALNKLEALGSVQRRVAEQQEKAEGMKYLRRNWRRRLQRRLFSKNW